MRQRQVLSGENQPDLSRKIYPACHRSNVITKETEPLSKSDSGTSRKERNKTIRWVVTIFFITILVSGTISFTSDTLMANSSMLVAFIILLTIVMVGIVFDIIGVAVTSADEKPFHSMASRKVPGAQDAIRLLRNAERVSSICNDVVGDICGVVSGSASATIAAQIIRNFDFSASSIIPLIMSALVAGLTVGGKAIGKTFAINSCTKIVHAVGKILWACHNVPKVIKKRKK